MRLGNNIHFSNWNLVGKANKFAVTLQVEFVHKGHPNTAEQAKHRLISFQIWNTKPTPAQTPVDCQTERARETRACGG